MGCMGSSAQRQGASTQAGERGGSSTSAKGPEKDGKAKPDERKRLLDYYHVGEMLGQGAFGVVYACKPLNKELDCAVKMVDKVETPVDKIKEEADMLQKMDHPNVIKCHDVIYEKCFVCIVMDRLRGGDLIMGMQEHWKSKGKIPVMSTVHITAQMTSSLHYLHKQSIIHRDVKGDNFLCDRPNVVNTDTRIVLTDFGTSIPCAVDERLHEKCGTKLYWAPEFYKLDYSLKVDLWAMGIVMYGLLNGKFPFRDERDVLSKQVTVPKGTPKECVDFLMSVLCRKEADRADSTKCMQAPWISGSVTQTGECEAPDAGWKPDEFNEGGANEGIQERRQELVERLHQQGKKTENKSAPKEEEHYWKEWFSIVDKHAKNSTLKYEWWSQNKVDEAGILSLNDAITVNEGGVTDTSDVIGQQLRDHGIDTKKFGTGKAKTLQQLASEVQSGAAVMMLDASSHKKLVRVVDIVLLRICAPGSKASKVPKYIVETGEKFADGRERAIVRLPGTKKEPHMNSKQTAEKIMNELLNLGDAKVKFSYNTKEVFEEQEESPSFPGVQTVYRKEIIEGEIEGDPNQNFIGKNSKGSKDWSKVDTNSNTKYFAWMSDKDCAKAGVKYKVPEEGSEVSGLVQAPIGLSEEELRKFFEANKIDLSKFGTGQAKSLKDISSELVKGESTLMQQQDGSIVRTVDVVVLKLIHAVTSSILVQTQQTFPDGTKASLKRLPGAKRRPDENQFLTARRVLKRQLKVEENHVTLDATNVQVTEEEKESLAYPGLRTTYRKRIITATLSR